MTTIPPAILDYWQRVFGDGPAPSVTVSDALPAKRPAMLLVTVDGTMRAAVRPELARRAGIDGTSGMSAGSVAGRLARAGVRLHDPDHLFYLAADAPPAPGRADGPRRLTEADRAAFDAFHAAASEQDREDAFVELDHWMVFGSFDGDRLVSAASMCLWPDGPIADLGVLTLADARGRGHARAVVDAIGGFARRQGHEPQYRCQIDNRASVAVAGACGFVRYGEWTVAADVPGGDDG